MLFLTERTQVVIVYTCEHSLVYSNPQVVKSRVPQDSWLDAMLFKIYISNAPGCQKIK